MELRATKTVGEREEDEEARLVRESPRDKPPRHDRQRNQVDPEPERDPDTDSDPDRSKNYKSIGGSSYDFRKSMKLVEAVYHGVDPKDHKPPAGATWEQRRDPDESLILRLAREHLDSELLRLMDPETKYRAALDLAICGAGPTTSTDLDPMVYNRLLAKLSGRSEPGVGKNTLLTIQSSTRGTVMTKEQKTAVDTVLSNLDTAANTIQERHASWGMPFETAKGLVNHLDKVADRVEAGMYGRGSLVRRQVETLKNAKVLKSDSDEPYMSTFNSPSKPIQTDADEPYMAAYADDQTQAVQDGKSSTGRALAP